MSVCSNWLYAEPAQKSNRPKCRSRKVRVLLGERIIINRARWEILLVFRFKWSLWELFTGSLLPRKWPETIYKHGHVGSASFSWPASNITWTIPWGKTSSLVPVNTKLIGKKSNVNVKCEGVLVWKITSYKNLRQWGKLRMGGYEWVWETTVKSLQGECVIFVGWGVRRSATLAWFCKIHTEVEHITRVTYS